MGAGGCVGILEGVSPQCDRVTLWTFGGRRLPFGAGRALLWEMGRYGSPLAMDGEVVVIIRLGNGQMGGGGRYGRRVNDMKEKEREEEEEEKEEEIMG